MDAWYVPAGSYSDTTYGMDEYIFNNNENT